MTKNRDLSFQAFRGIAIICVVAIHSIVGSENFSHSNWNFYFIFIYRQLLNFAVPAFLFISGYWVAKENFNNLKEYKFFLNKRLKKVLVPYFFWSLFAILLSITLFGFDLSSKTIIYKLLTGGAMGPYYFLLLIAQLYIITPILIYLLNKQSNGLIIIISLNFLSLLVLYIIRIYLNINPPLALYALPFYSWIIFFALGIFVKNHNVSNKCTSYRIYLLLIFFIILSCTEAYFLLKLNLTSFAFSAVKFSSFFYSIAVCFAFLKLRQKIKNWPQILVKLGDYSFGIYLIHIFIIHFITKALNQIDILVSIQPIFQFIALVSTISISYIVIVIIRNVTPRYFWANLLGFN